MAPSIGESASRLDNWHRPVLRHPGGAAHEAYGTRPLVYDCDGGRRRSAATQPFWKFPARRGPRPPPTGPDRHRHAPRVSSRRSGSAARTPAMIG
jgi:hypothetical protein